MLIPVNTLARSVDDVDFSDLTASQRTGPAVWTDDGLDVPFDPPLSAAELAAVTLRLTTNDHAEEQQRAALAAYVQKPSPTVDETNAQVKLLTLLAMRLMDGPRIDVP